MLSFVALNSTEVWQVKLFCSCHCVGTQPQIFVEWLCCSCEDFEDLTI